MPILHRAEHCAMATILLEVKTLELTQALKLLCKVEKKVHSLCLRYCNGLLSLSIGSTQEDIAASGSWPEPVHIKRRWADTLSTYRPDVAVTTLSVSEGKLWARDFAVSCSVGGDPYQDEDVRELQSAIESAVKSLSHHGVTAQEIETLIEGADPKKSGIWGPGDRNIIGDIARAWGSLFTYGVEPSDIRQLLHRKSRDLWKNSPSRR